MTRTAQPDLHVAGEGRVSSAAARTPVPPTVVAACFLMVLGIAALAPYAVALQDVQTRILPALGTGSALDELRSALMELEPALSQPDAYEGALARANAAALQLQPDSTLFPDFDVVRLVLEQIQAVVQAPADRAQAAPQAASRREQ